MTVMTPSLLWLLHGWRVALLLVVLACASPGRARAECGDYVVILNHASTQPSTSTQGATDLPARPKTPCSGANCSRGPNRHGLPVAPGFSSGPQAKEMAQLPCSIEQADSLPAHGCDFISPRPVYRPTSIFHPPRRG